MSIYINGTLLPIQPSQVQEEPLQIQGDTESLDGSMQRNYLNQKWQATLTFENLDISGYQQLSGFILAGVTCTYKNDQTAEASMPSPFTALATWQKQPYVRGASLLQPITVTFRQV